jgi:hypothetical protein
MRCFSCVSTNQSQIKSLYGYNVCDSCEPTLGLYKDNTIRKHIASYEKKREAVPENPTYVQEVDYRVEAMEEYYIRRRLKLLHIQARLKAIGKQD